jgi:hypothetical protein
VRVAQASSGIALPSHSKEMRFGYTTFEEKKP